MAHKISKEVVAALIAGKRKNGKNTSTDGKSLYLHGNRIANMSLDNGPEFSLAGWNTPTTRERLNAFFDGIGVTLRVHQTGFRPYVWNYRTHKDYPIEDYKWYSPKEFTE